MSMSLTATVDQMKLAELSVEPGCSGSFENVGGLNGHTVTIDASNTSHKVSVVVAEILQDRNGKAFPNFKLKLDGRVVAVLAVSAAADPLKRVAQWNDSYLFAVHDKEPKSEGEMMSTAISYAKETGIYQQGDVLVVEKAKDGHASLNFIQPRAEGPHNLRLLFSM